ncbi:fimbrial protein FimV [Acinetobacter indicus]|uniref:fimbrial protein FimV n=1 Tax=Acinetobacter indicus TaxID=756892 RepID=UPI000CEC97D9|nr:fimbrial protein FimV [Acinetobacter indicus]MDM1244638.1 fimbrial protein FimV [Acinetobacter indicus]MDM1288673.1 fimbrial protein FimV [Acinetobacter indicus]MDV4311985.1 fimbrial protein FimV [Acinetobacter indicus]
MLIYVIPFILLLVIALVLKKREANKESEPAAKKPAAASKTKAKKSTTTKKTTVKTAVVAEPVAEPQGSTPLPADLRQTIETQIRDRNFFSAEAQINQALKRDPSLHELYLLLLDVHLTQKDEFATRQLLDHLKNLGLEDILAQANAKVDAQKAPQAKEELIEFTPATPVAVQATPAEKAQTTADFDALIQSSSSSTASTSFDQLQQSLKTETPAEAKTEELPALDLEFTPSTPAAPVNTPAPAKTEEVQPLEFNLSFDSAASTQVAAPVTPVEPVTPAAQEPQALDFSFELEKTATEATPATTPAVTTPPAEEKSEFNFDFSISPTPVAEQPVEPAVTAPADTAPLFQFDLDSAPTIEATPATPEAPMVEEPAMAAVAATAVDPHDPLIQSFPELAEVNEIQLNLELAQQYIELGAYNAARALLAEKEANYSAAQQQHATQLLNQIAS